MAKFINSGDSIEAEKSLINTRKTTLKGSINKKGKSLFKYKCQKHSKVEITEELNPKVCLFKNSSSLNMGDILEADIIEVLAIKILNFSKESNFSSTHGIQMDYPQS